MAPTTAFVISTVFRSDRPDLSNSISGTLEIPLGQTNCTWQVRNHMNLSIPLSLQSKHLHKHFQPSFEKNDAPNGLKKHGKIHCRTPNRPA